MRLIEILQQERMTKQEAFYNAQEQRMEQESVPMPNFVICPEMEAYQALFERCVDF